MTTQTIETGQQADTAQPLRGALQLAINATWQASGRVPVAPFCVSQTERSGLYVGDLHYTEVQAVHLFAVEYEVDVSSAPSAAGGTRYQATADIDGIRVQAWAFAPAEAGERA